MLWLCAFLGSTTNHAASWLLLRLQTPSQGAATAVWAAVAPELKGQSGAYLEDCRVSKPWKQVRVWGCGVGRRPLLVLGLGACGDPGLACSRRLPALAASSHPCCSHPCTHAHRPRRRGTRTWPSSCGRPARRPLRARCSAPASSAPPERRRRLGRPAHGLAACWQQQQLYWGSLGSRGLPGHCLTSGTFWVSAIQGSTAL